MEENVCDLSKPSKSFKIDENSKLTKIFKI